jgi:cytochrome oxidase assembly protein ShyY1
MRNKKSLIVIMLVCNILLLSLGVWQIQRGLSKQTILNKQKYIQQHTAAATNTNIQNIQSVADLTLDKTALSTSSALKTFTENFAYQPIKLTGIIQAPYLYLYRQHQTQSGYWIINILHIPAATAENDKYVLYAHSFIETSAQKRFLSLEELKQKTQEKMQNSNFTKIIDINAVILPHFPKVFNLQKDKFQAEASILQNIDSINYAKYYKIPTHKMLNFIVAQQSSILPSLLQLSHMTPEKHFGYALTWLGLFIVCLYFSYLLCVKNDSKK